MKTIEDIHFYYEQLPSDIKKELSATKDPLHDNTDFLLAQKEPPKYLAGKIKKYRHADLSDDHNEFFRVADFYQYMMCCAYLHKRSGKKVIRFENKTVLRQLEETDALRMSTDDINDPMFDTFYIDARSGGSLYGFFVFFREHSVDVTIVREADGIMTHDTISIPVLAGIELSKAVDLAIAKGKDAAEKGGKAANIVWEESVRSNLNMLFSILFYLQSAISDPSRVIETPMPKRKTGKGVNEKKEAIRQAKAYHTFLLKTTSAEQTEFSEGGSRGEAGMPLTLVRGHYRRQPIGPREEKKHKTIWIKPFWKGSEASDTLHIYKA